MSGQYFADTFTLYEKRENRDMGQVTIYLDDDTEQKMRAAAHQEKTSLSRWVARLIGEKTLNSWPSGFSKLAGAWPDAVLAEDLRASAGKDSPREPF